MIEPSLQIEHAGAIAHIWLNRPDVHNAFDAALIAELTAAFQQLSEDGSVRVIVLGGRGKSFSAGAQIQWMKAQGSATKEENLVDARCLAELFRTIADCPKPTFARVHGAAIGGGVGLVAACDIAIGSTNATFSTSEVRLGLIPATIAPYVVRAIGERQAQRYFLTAERLDAHTAERIGLLHEVVAEDQLDARVAMLIQAVLAGGPLAQRAAKELIRAVGSKPITVNLLEDTARLIAEQRAGNEAKEGLAAFLEKRTPSWSLKQ